MLSKWLILAVGRKFATNKLSWFGFIDRNVKWPLWRVSKADISSFSPLSDKVSPVQLTCFKIMSSNNSRDSDCQFLICPANSLEKFRHISLFHDRDNGRVFPQSGLICQFKLSPELKVNWRSIARKFSHPFARSKLNSWAFSCNNDTFGQPCRIICQSFEENFENANLLQ